MAFRCCAVQWKPISRNWLPLYYTTSECHEWLYGAISRLMIADFFDISAENRCLYVCQFVTREPKLVRFIGSFEKSRVREIGGEIKELAWVRQIQGNQSLVRDTGRFGKPRVREIGLPLYCTTSECLDWLYGAISRKTDGNRFLWHFCRESMLICLGIKDSKELMHKKCSTSTLLTRTDSCLKSYLKLILTKQVIRIAENTFVICQ